MTTRRRTAAALAVGMAVSGLLAATSGAAVLHDQHNRATATGTNSQNYRVGYVAEAADDFIVPAGQRWSLQHVEVAGRYVENVTAFPGVSVGLYVNARNVAGHNVPGEPLALAYNRRPTSGWGTGAFSVPVDFQPLGPGRY